jgi:hypothetical protein
MPISEDLLERIRNNDPTLTSVDLRNSQIGPEEAQALATALQTNRTLTILALQHNEIEPEGLNAIEAMRQRNIMIPEITRIIASDSREKLSTPQIKFISNEHHPENCVRILENLVRTVDNDHIPDFLQRVKNFPGVVGAMILFTVIKAQESDLPQTKLNLPKDKLDLVIKELFEKGMGLSSLFKAGGVTRNGITNALRLAMSQAEEFIRDEKAGEVTRDRQAGSLRSVPENILKLKTVENHILGFLKKKW